MYILEDVVCGGGILTMDRIIPDMTSLVVTLIKIGIPVLLIIFGMLDLGRILSAALVFFVVVIVQLVFNLVAKNQTNVWDCVSCFVSGVDDGHKANSCR